MKVTLTEREGEYGDLRSFHVRTPHYKLQFRPGEPEDNTLSRDWNDVLDIPKLIEEAFEAGKNGETLEIERVYIAYGEDD